MNIKPHKLSKSTMVMTAALGAILSIPAAIATPRELYNKGLQIEYSVTATVPGHRGLHDVVSNITRTIYVSSAGRLFERGVWSNQGGTAISENSPTSLVNKGGEAREMSFRGNTLVAHIGYASGAGQLIIHFDPTFSTCDGALVFGTDAGKVMARRGRDGIVHQIVSIKASNVNCRVTPGNPFR